MNIKYTLLCYFFKTEKAAEFAKYDLDKMNAKVLELLKSKDAGGHDSYTGTF